MYRQPNEVTHSAWQGSVSPPSLFQAIRTFCTIHHHLHPFWATAPSITITTTTRFMLQGGFDPPPSLISGTIYTSFKQQGGSAFLPPLFLGYLQPLPPLSPLISSNKEDLCLPLPPLISSNRESWRPPPHSLLSNENSSRRFWATTSLILTNKALHPLLPPSLVSVRRFWIFTNLSLCLSNLLL